MTVQKFIAIVLMLICQPGLYGQTDFGTRLTEARTLDTDRKNQVLRLKAVLVDLEKTDYYDTLALAHYYIAYRYLKFLKDYESAISHSQKAEDYFQKSDWNGMRRARVYSYFIEANSILEHHNEVIEHFEKKHHSKNFTEIVDQEATVIRSVAESYRKTGDFETAKIILSNYLLNNRAKDVLPKYIANLYLEKSINEREMEDLDNAMVSIQKALELEELVPIEDKEVDQRPSYTNQMALIYLKREDENKALQLFDSELNKPDLSSKFISSIANNAFVSLAQMKLYESAFDYAKKGFISSTKLSENEVELKYQALDNLACAHMYLNEIDSAQYYLDKAYKYLTNSTDLPAIIDLKNSDNKKWISNLLYDQARIFERAYDLNKQRLSLEKAKFALLKLDSLVAFYLDDQILAGSVVQLRKEITKYYSLATDVCYQLYDLEGFLFFSEKNRGLLLLDKFVDPEYSDELLAQNLTDSINSLKEKKFKLDYLYSLNPKDSLKRLKTRVEADILSFQTRLNSLRSFSPTQIADVKQLLENPIDETFYYQFGDSSLYLLNLSPEGNYLDEIFKKDELVKLLSEYDENLKAGRSKAFNESLSSRLFQILFAKYYSGQEQMTILPHGELSFLPFESLLIPGNKFLIEQTTLSYAISLTLQQEWKKTSGRVNEIHVISPMYDSTYMDSNDSKTRGTINFDFLAHSQKEAKKIAGLMDANLIEAPTVDKAIVKNSMATADIFHFSGHSYLTENDNQYTFMALGHDFENPDQTFSVAEVFHQNTDAELVFLNSCNTSKSDLINGEGVFSLSRAFLSSGSKSVVSTLWEVDDKTSGEISTTFYEKLKQGLPKAKALQQAKIEYLNNVSQIEKRHPYYWAGIVLVGNPDSLTFHNNSLTYILVAIGILLLGGIWFLKKRSIHPG